MLPPWDLPPPPEQMDEMEDDIDLSPEELLFSAIHNDDLDMATYLITIEGVEVNITNSTHKTPLYLALEHLNECMVTLLLDQGADINQSSYCSTACAFETPVVTAARLERLDFVEMFLNRGCEMEGLAIREGKTSLQWAATHGNIPMARQLLSSGADINWIGPYFHTALHYATMAERSDMVQWLLDNGAEISINGDARSPLHIAAVKGSFNIVKILVKHDCEMDTRDSFNFTPFSLACLRGHVDIVEYMGENCKTGTNLNLNDGLQKAAECGHLKVIKYLIHKGADVNSVNSSGESALSIASRGQPQTVDVLLAHGATLITVDNRGYMPLQHAVLREQVDIALKLICHGAPLHTWCDNTESPLKISLAISNPVLASCLLEAGCNLEKEPWFTRRLAMEKLREVDYKCPRSKYFISDQQPLKDQWRSIIHKIGAPPSLAEASRYAIRLQLSIANGGRSILRAVDSLPLPKQLRTYTALDDYFCE